MTKEQIKNALPLIQAFAEGKIIQYRDPSLGIKEWSDLEYSVGVPVNNLLEELNNYRVKPEPPYRPFRNAEECWQEMLKHQPFGIVSSKHDKAYMAFESLDDGICNFNGYREESFESAFDDIQFADGTPFGIKTEQ